MQKKPYIIGIAGGSGSGKTTLAQKLNKETNPQTLILNHDSYYKDQTHLPMSKRVQTNYDHPDSLETNLLDQHLKKLSNGKPVDIPNYDFTQHTRSTETTHIDPLPIIIVEGILIFTDQNLRKHFDLKIFVDTPDDIRFIRRLKRDTTERNRTTQSVIDQYLDTVRPMHHTFAEPSKKYADIIIPEGGQNPQAISILLNTIKHQLNNS